MVTAVRTEFGRYFAAQQFLTRLPAPSSTPYAPADLAGSLGWFPAVGVVVGGIVGGAAVALRDLVSPTFATVVAVALGAAVTGAFHEDGFADTCDAFGGYTVERRREIMRDSRIGTFGALGLCALFFAKVSALSMIVASTSWLRVVGVAICAHTVSRAATVLALRIVPTVVDATSKTVLYRATIGRLAWALAVPSVPLAIAVLGWDAAFLGGAVIVIIEAARWFFPRFSGGISGDGLGAINQVVEVLTFAVAVHHLVGR